MTGLEQLPSYVENDLPLHETLASCLARDGGQFVVYQQARRATRGEGDRPG
jgi:hypothetical protein